MTYFLSILCAFVISATANHVRDISIEYRQLLNQPRLLEIPNSRSVNYLGLNLDLKIAGPVYWNNIVHIFSSSDRVKWVGWLFEIGVKISRFDFFYKHHSQHTLDGVHPWMDFPLQDSVGFRWRVYP